MRLKQQDGGESSIIFAFDERRETMFLRTEGLGIPLREYVEKGLIELRAVDPAELSPGEFAHKVRIAVQGDNEHTPVKIVIY